MKPAFEPKLRLTFEYAKPAGENKLVDGVSGGDGAPATMPSHVAQPIWSYESITVTRVETRRTQPRDHLHSARRRRCGVPSYSLVLDNGRLQFR